MLVLRLVPVLLSLLLLGAHFLRAGNVVALGAVLAFVALLWVRRPWAASAIQIALAAGTLEWLLTLWRIAAARASAGEPVTRLVLILGAVAAFTALSLLVFRSAAVRGWYRS